MFSVTFGDPHAGLDRCQQQRVVAPSEPGGPVRGSEQRFDLVEVEVVDAVLLMAFERDRDHASDRLKVLGVPQCHVPVERVDRRQPGVPGPGAVAPVLLEVGEERTDQRRVEIVDVQLTRLLANPLMSEGQEQPKRVSVGGDGLRA